MTPEQRRLWHLIISIFISCAIWGCLAEKEDDGLIILPNSIRVKIALGRSTAVSCIVKDPNPALSGQPVWMFENGVVIGEPIITFGSATIYAKNTPEDYTTALFVNLMSKQMSGNYTCRVSFGNQEIKKTVNLLAFMGITWTNANPNQSAVLGTDYKIMCEVMADPAPHVDWFRDGRMNDPIKTDDRHVVTTNGLFVKNISMSDEGIYTCRAFVQLTGELDDRNIRLTVHTVPMMETRELQVVVREGEPASISCKARGRPPPTYTWIKESTHENLSMASRFGVDSNSGILTIDRVEAGDYGYVVCRATNEAGFNESRIMVDVVVPPKVIELYNTTYPEMSEGQLECKAIGRPKPSISFIKESTNNRYTPDDVNDNRIAVAPTTRVVGDQWETTATLFVSDLTRADDGLYECVAENTGGVARKKGLLTVEFKPTFENMPNFPVWSWNGQSVNLTCIAESIPNATIKWKFHDADLVQSPQVRIYGAGPISYVTVIPTDSTLYGYYKCIATNKLGEAVHTIQLREAFPPGPITQVRQESITATTVSFTIFGPGDNLGPPIIAYTAQYKESGNYDWHLAANRTWSVNSPYIVENLRPMFVYDFRFAAVNQVGVGFWGAPLVVRMPKRSAPEAPRWREAVITESTVHGKFPDRYEINWKIPANNGEPIDSYVVKYCPVVKVSGDWRPVKQDECIQQEVRGLNAISYEVRGLRPDSTYRIELMAHNALGFSPAAHMYLHTALGVDRGGFPRAQSLSSATIVGLSVAFIVLLVVIVDLTMLCCKRAGFIAWLCSRRLQKQNDEESKLGRDEKEPLKDTDPMKRQSSIEFDGHRTYTSSGSILGKNSAV